jgi:hypothetical protein
VDNLDEFISEALRKIHVPLFKLIRETLTILLPNREWRLRDWCVNAKGLWNFG